MNTVVTKHLNYIKFQNGREEHIVTDDDLARLALGRFLGMLCKSDQAHVWMQQAVRAELDQTYDLYEVDPTAPQLEGLDDFLERASANAMYDLTLVERMLVGLR